MADKDIDIMISGGRLSGLDFAKYVMQYLREVKKEEPNNIGVIKANPEKSKFLETATINLYGHSIDFTAPRAEIYEEDSRIPAVVSTTPEQDAKRRDFSINSLFFNIETEEVEDFTNHGIEDLKNGILRAPQDAKKMFLDDGLRILRAIRFATRFGFELDPELINAAKNPVVQDALQKKISRERIEIELRKMLGGQDPVRAMRLIKELGLLDYVFVKPEHFEKWEMDQKSTHHDFDVWEHTMQALTNLQEIIKDRNLSAADKFLLNLATVMHDVGKLDPAIKGTKQLEDKIVNTYHGHEEASMHAAEHILRNLPGITVDEIEKVKTLIDGARRINPDRRDTSEEYKRSRKTLGKFVREMGDLWEHAIDIGHADSAGHRLNQFSAHPRTYYESMKKQIREFDPKSIQTMKPMINGTELMEMFGRKGGKWVGELIKELIDWQLENPKATRQEAETFVRNIYKERGLDKMAGMSFTDETVFPKQCAVCGAIYNTKEEFLALPFRKKYFDNPKAEETIRCSEGFGSDLIYRDCPCETTLAMKIPCEHGFKNISKRTASTDDIKEGSKIVELWHGITDEKELISNKDGSYTILPDNFGKIWFAERDAEINRTMEDSVFNKAIIRMKVLFTIIKKDGVILDKYPMMSGWERSKTPDFYFYRGSLKVSPDEIEFPNVDEADDEPNKYEREAKDPKWQDIYIEKDGTKLTRKQIRDYYVKNATKIMKEIKDEPVMLYIATGKNKNILKRNHNNKPIIITNADPKNSGNSDNLLYWVDRHLLSIHKVYGMKTKRGVVDLDLHGDFPFSKAKEYAKNVASEIKKEFNVSSTLWNSGGTGIHIEFDLKQEEDIDKLRGQLKDMLDKLNKNYDNITTGLVKENGLRSDISTLHSNGNIRTRYTLGETYGKPKEPINKVSTRDE